MNKLKLLASASLFTLLAIGFAGCGDDEVYDGKVCQTAKDCESGTKTKYLCIGETSKSNSKKVCRIDCTTGGPSACPSGGANYNCVPAGSTHKVCMKDAQEAQNQCGGKECNLTTHECKNNVCVEKQQPEDTTFYRLLIVDTTQGNACNEKDAGADIVGIRILSADGTTSTFFKEIDKSNGAGIHNDYSTGTLKDTAFTLMTETGKETCLFDSLSSNKANTTVLGCGGKAIFGRDNKTESAFKKGNKVEVFEYSGATCSGTSSPEDYYKVYACKSPDANLSTSTEVEVGQPGSGKDCILLGEGLHGYSGELDVPAS